MRIRSMESKKQFVQNLKKRTCLQPPLRQIDGTTLQKQLKETREAKI